MKHPQWQLPPERYFDPDPAQRRIAGELLRSRGRAAPHLPAWPRFAAAFRR